MADVPASKREYRGSVTSKLVTAPISASHRTDRAWSSLPRASSKAPKAIGVQMARLSKPIFVFPVSWRSRRAPSSSHPELFVQPDKPRHQHENADDHRERIVIDVAGL